MSFDQSSFKPVPLSRWVSFLSTIACILLFLVFVGAILIVGAGSILGGIAVLLGGLVTVGILLVFCMIAEDVRDIKNTLDEYIHNHP